MRTGITVSIIGHAVILGLGLIAFPDMRSLESEKIEALPVELISVDEITDLAPGIESSEELPEETPQPTPEIEAEAPSPEPEEIPAETPVEAAEAPPPPEPAPEPEPEPEPTPPPEPVAPPAPQSPPEPAPEPERDLADLLEELPEPEPEPPVVTDPNVPRVRPEPPPRVARVEPPAPPEEEEAEFNADDISALLNKQEPQGGGAPEQATEPQTIGSIDGRAEAAMTQSEIAALKARLYRCWNPPIAVREAGALVVEVQISLLPDGSLAGQPVVTRVDHASDPVAQVAVEAALRAVVQCAPFGDILRPEKYAIWSRIDFVFDPREMLGG
ncbi:MAG: hypothetical protein ACRED5_07185 [Propylenella sp.]